MTSVHESGGYESATAQKSVLSSAPSCLAAIATVFTLSGNLSASFAATVTTTMTGHITSVSPALLGLGVQTNDPFVFVFNYDDAMGVLSQTTVNRSEMYQLVTDTFVTGMAGWYGSLPTFLVASGHGPTSSVMKTSWYRPATTLHHEDWVIQGFELTMVTNYVPAGNISYGWYRYGQDPQMTFLIDSVITTPVPEPETYGLLLAGLFAVGLAARRRTARH